MHGELETPPDLGGRYVRVCQEHKRILEGLTCSAGQGHEVEKFGTLDRHTGVTVYEDVEIETGRGGVTPVVEPPRRPATEPPRGFWPLPRRRARPLPEPAPLLPPVQRKPKEEDPRMKKARKNHVIEGKRFEDARKNVLFIQLKEFTPKDPESTVDRYRVHWRLTPFGGKKKKTNAIAALAADEKLGRADFAEAIKSALKEGWVETVTRPKGREIVCQPIPPAAKRPGRRPAAK